MQDAVNRLRPQWDEYAEPYLTVSGHLARWKLISIQDVYALVDGRLSPHGTEVYSRLRTVNMKKEYRWEASRSAPNKRLQPAAPRNGVKALRLNRNR